ncbi:hypothetical protein PVAND_012898 [Polypedilum vanderplanki]|uniref:Peptidase C1A papain C-terminal domain-containing protein n=1 Tax=Polypedilum vanderplanki TaxID=319348 RepID=A0A9J6CN18_POLVA|nr:hypothetical protein PVAND_012898 [Polypedilum vanderplanki]
MKNLNFLSLFLISFQLIEAASKNGVRATTNSVKSYKNDSHANVKLKGLNDLMDFDTWAKKYRKNYKNYVKSKKDAEKAFKQNAASIKAHNSRKTETYERKLQAHSDLTYEEQKIYRMGFIDVSESENSTIPDFSSKKTYTKVNYTKLFPPAKDQGLCGCCFIFATVSILEYISRINGDNDIYSEQDLLDCDTLDTGCDGGWLGNAFRYVRDKGISNGLVYPYEGWNNTCRKYLYPSIFSIGEVCTYSLNGNEILLQALIDQGPVAGAIALTDGFTSYSSGVFYDKNCSSTVLDHAITIVGYGTDLKGGDFWLIRNSWGTDWGLNGDLKKSFQ